MKELHGLILIQSSLFKNTFNFVRENKNKTE